MTYPPQGPSGPEYEIIPTTPQVTPPNQPHTGIPYSATPVSPNYQAPRPPYTPPPPEPPGERPGSATAAGILIMATVGFALIAGASIIIPERSGTVSDDARVGMVIFGTLNIVTAGGFIALALGVLRGRNGARITAFVVYGTALAFNGCMGSIILAVSQYEELPWQAVTFVVVQFVLLIADIGVIVLLAQRESSQWFRAMSQARRMGTI